MRIVYITAKDSAQAKKISRHLLEKKLAACINIFPIESMYWFDEKIQEDVEFVLLIKTIDENFEIIGKEVEKIHSYKIPAVFSWKIEKINKKYRNWINSQLKK